MGLLQRWREDNQRYDEYLKEVQRSLVRVKTIEDMLRWLYTRNTFKQPAIQTGFRGSVAPISFKVDAKIRQVLNLPDEEETGGAENTSGIHRN